MSEIKKYIPGDGASHVSEMTWIGDTLQRGAKPIVSPEDILYVLASDYDRLNAEHARLRAALVAVVATEGQCKTEEDDHGAYGDALEIARTALEIPISQAMEGDQK